MFKRFYARLLMQRGQQQLAFGSRRKAFRLFTKAVALEPSPANLYNLALAHLNLLEYEKALPVFERIYDPDKPEPLTALSIGQTYLLLDRWREAVKVFQNLAARYPQLKTLADYATMASNPERRERYRRSTGLQFQAMLAREDGDSRQALALLREAEPFATEDAVMMHNIGVLMMELKEDKELTLSYFRKSMALAPENVHFKKHFRKVWQKLNR